MKVTAYLNAGVTHSFPARSRLAAREIASRIVREGLWVDHGDGTESYFPITVLSKVKIEPEAEASPPA